MSRVHRNRAKKHKVCPEFIGRAQMTREGFIFVIIEGQDDVFVKASNTQGALDGDTVRVAVTREKGTSKRREGHVVEIVERSKKPFVGYVHFAGSNAWLLMQSRNMPYDIILDQQEVLSLGGAHGMKAAVVVDGWSRKYGAPFGHVTDVLGVPGENDTEMHAILAEFGLPYRFEKEVEDAADSISDKITREDLKGRKDFRDIFTFTIDPADAKDFDDALSFRPLKGGNLEIGVHIADVSHYVRPGSAVDEEARERGTSVYLVDRTVPMLPEKLCNKLCSLRPNEDKLTFSVVFEMTPEGQVRKSWIGKSIIRSDYRLAYEQAQQIIESVVDSSDNEISEGAAVRSEIHATLGTVRRGTTQAEGRSGGVERSETISEWSCRPSEEDNCTQNNAELFGNTQLVEAILTLNAIALKLKAKRFKAGAIDFDRPEMKVKVDEKGHPVEVFRKYSKEANWLIEEYMLLANRTVAEFVSKTGKTFVYRVHGEPDEIKLDGLKLFAKGFGYKMKSLNSLLQEAKGKPEFQAFENLALRAMAKAKYSTDNIGHYGLTFDYYTHFTSPIRRYPDLMVHRLLEMYLSRAKDQDKDYYEKQCLHASSRELVAADAERTSTKYKLVEYMQDKVGQEFEGTISGITEWGMYVEIQPTFIEGMVALRDIRSDFFEFDEKHYRLVGKRTHRKYRLGDRVRIRVKNTNLEQRLLDYELIDIQS